MGEGLWVDDAISILLSLTEECWCSLGWQRPHSPHLLGVYMEMWAETKWLEAKRERYFLPFNFPPAQNTDVMAEAEGSFVAMRRLSAQKPAVRVGEENLTWIPVTTELSHQPELLTLDSFCAEATPQVFCKMWLNSNPKHCILYNSNSNYPLSSFFAQKCTRALTKLF